MASNGLVLNNETRKMIYDHIIANPGVSFIILKNIFNLNESTLRYHLKYLEKNEKISPSLETGKRFYYPYKSAGHVIQKRSDSNIFIEYKLSGVQERIMSVIKRYPKINQKELSNRSGINRITLGKNLKKLINLCVVRKIPNGNKVLYEYIPNEQLRYEILKRLLIKLLHNEIDEKTFLELKRKLD